MRASDKQIWFIKKLLGEREWPITTASELAVLTKAEASVMIQKLLDSPRIAAAIVGLDLSPVPAGRYAVPGTDGVLRFIRIDKPEDGKYAGNIYVKVQASDEYHRLGAQYKGQSYAGKSIELIKALLADARAAAIRYGHEIGACGICGRTLTDEESRARGLGPVCAEKVGW